MMRQIPMLAKLRISELATAIGTVVSGGQVLTLLDKLDENPKMDIEAELSTGELTDFSSDPGNFNLHDLR